LDGVVTAAVIVRRVGGRAVVRVVAGQASRFFAVCGVCRDTSDTSPTAAAANRWIAGHHCAESQEPAA
jgi:hypothetical protein